MKRTILLCVLLLTVGGVAHSQERPSVQRDIGWDCASMAPGESVTAHTKHFSDSTSGLRAYISITAERNKADVRNAEGAGECQCRVDYRLYLARHGSRFRLVKRLVTFEQDTFGGQIVGLSANGHYLAANFYAAAGDSNTHRPVIVDLRSGQARLRELGTHIFDQLPSCDYGDEFTRVTNHGEAVIHIPKSDYVDEGCPDQGNWLFNLDTGKVRRAGKR